MADPAHDLFEEFRSGQMVRIDKCFKDREAETQLLDFKRNNDATGPIGTLEKEGRQVLAKALSAFANAGGGVLVWGIEDKGDRAFKRHPIPDVQTFVTQLRKYTPQIVTPPLDGVKHEAIPDPKLNGEGYAVTYIPDGKVKPHMATANTEAWTYFLRSGESSKAMPDSAVRAFVMSGARPSLTIRARITPPIYLETVSVHNYQIGRPEPRSVLVARIGLYLRNDGTAMAEKVAVAVENVPDVNYGDLLGGMGTTVYEDEEPKVYTLCRSGFMEPMYPDQEFQVGSLEFRTMKMAPLGSYYGPTKELRFRVKIYAQHFTRTQTVVFPAESLAATSVRKTGP